MNPQSRAPGVDLVWLVPLAALVVVGSWFTNLAEDHGSVSGHQPWLAAALGAVAALGLFWSLGRPLPGAPVAFGAVFAFVVLDLRDGPVYLTLAAAAFLTAARVPVARWLRVVGGGTLAVCAALVLRAVADYDNERSLWQLAAVLAVTTAGAALGTVVRTRALTLTERARAAVTREQLHMAQDLHDGVGHGLAVIAMQAGVGLHVLDSDPAAARTALEVIRDTSRESLDALRAELAQLAGAPARPHRGVADLAELVDRVRTAGPAVRLAGSAGELPEAVDAAVYAVVQEALTNVLRHSSATAVVVRLERLADRVSVTVEDDGPASPEHSEGMGLRGMRTRVEALGGTLSAGPRQDARRDGGFSVRAELPL